jgi:DNA-directed RNA polymerase specialized sigma24 family protein
MNAVKSTTSVEVLGRYSNLRDQGERIQDLLEMVPSGPRQAKVRTLRRVQHRLRSDEVEELLTRYRTGGKVGELATIFGVHRDTVSEILDRHAVTRRQLGIPPELVEKVIAAYRSGSSLATIGAEMSVDPGTVALTLRKAGVQPRPRRGWQS